jgi:uncharacterized protein involved in high-affinity Fe2+ transport
MIRFFTIAGIATLSALGTANAAQEFYIGEPVVQSGMQVVPNYLTGIQMDRMAPGMSMAKDAVHIEADVHATKDEKHGFTEDAWIPYLTIKYTLTKPGTAFKATGKLWPMTASDGPHYSSNGFIRHVDAASGVPAWWKPITASWTFAYPSKTK